MFNETRFYIYKNATDFEAPNGRIYSGVRWILRDADGERIGTYKTRKYAVETLRGNFGQDVEIVFGMPEDDDRDPAPAAADPAPASAEAAAPLTNIKNLPEGEFFSRVNGSDSTAFIVERRTAKTAVVREVLVERDPDFTADFEVGGFAAHCKNQHKQTWLFRGLDTFQYLIRETKNGWTCRGMRFVPGARNFYDFNF